jgi:hypothetical protein
VTRTALLKSLLMTLVAVTLAAACAPSPRQRPIQTAPVETGAGSLTEARKQIEGTWTLRSFTSYAPGGAEHAIKAKGRLTYDAFGNLELTGNFEDPADVARAGKQTLTFKGRAVIDPAKKVIVLADIQGNVPSTAVPEEMSPDRVRHYEVSADTLTLTTREGDRVLARTVWARTP